MRKVKFGLRYKILILLTIIPLLTLSAYLVLAMNIFKEDKLAYVFDSNANIASSLAGQIKIQVNQLILTSRPLFQAFLKKKSTQISLNFPQEAIEVFQDLRNLSALAVFAKNKTGGFTELAIMDREELRWNQFRQEVSSELSSLLQSAVKGSVVLSKAYLGSKVLIVEKWIGETEEFYFVMLVSLPELVQTIESSYAQKLYLVGSRGQIVMGPTELIGTNIQQQYHLHFLQNLNALVEQGTEEVTDERGDEFLVSYARVRLIDQFILSIVPKKKALSAVGVLIQKSILFFGLLICITVILSLLASKNLTATILSLVGATRKVSEGDFNIKVQVSSNDEVGVLADNFNIMAAEVSRLISQTAEKARMEGELQTAKTVQETLFPPSRNKIHNLEIVGHYEPASECGGDWWHCSKVGSKVFLWIGDATGHGAPAALITSAAKSASTIIESMDIGPAEALRLMNKSICEVAKGRIMMTFFLAAFDSKTRVLKYSNASHDPPFLIKRKSMAPKKKDLITLNEVICPRLGQSLDSVYTEAEVVLDKEDMIVFYTDGVPDIRNSKNEAWGEREFVKTILQSVKDYPSAEKATFRVVETFSSFREDGQLVDDVTFFISKYDEV